MEIVADAKAVDAREEKENNGLFWVGVGCAVGGNFLSSLSFQLQRLAHVNNEKGVPYTQIPQWWLGFVFMAAGEVGNFLAYGMAPASLVSPLGAVAVVSNAVLSRVVLEEDLSYQKIAGVVVAIAGSALIAVSAPDPQNDPSSRKSDTEAANAVFNSLVSWRAFVYLLVVLLLFLFVANPRNWAFAITQQARESAVIWNCILCGLMGAITVMSSKGVSTALNQAFAGNADMFVRIEICWLTYILILAAVGSIVQQLKYLNEALIHFGSSLVVPVYYVVFTSITISAGMVLFLELDFHPVALGISLFSLGVLLSFFGVFLINSLQTAQHHCDAGAEAPTAEEQYLAQDTSIDLTSVDLKNFRVSAVDAVALPTIPQHEATLEPLPSVGETGLHTLFDELDVDGDGVLDSADLAHCAECADALEERRRLARELHAHFLSEEALRCITFPRFEQWYHNDLASPELRAAHEELKDCLRRWHVVLALRLQSHSRALAVVAATPGLQLCHTLRLSRRPTASPAEPPHKPERLPSQRAPGLSALGWLSRSAQGRAAGLTNIQFSVRKRNGDSQQQRAAMGDGESPPTPPLRAVSCPLAKRLGGLDSQATPAPSLAPCDVDSTTIHATHGPNSAQSLNPPHSCASSERQEHQDLAQPSSRERRRSESEQEAVGGDWDGLRLREAGEPEGAACGEAGEGAAGPLSRSLAGAPPRAAAAEGKRGSGLGSSPSAARGLTGSASSASD